MKQSLLLAFALTFMVLVGLGSASSFDIQLSDQSVSSCPGTANTIKVGIENMYRDADTIYLSLELPAGWSGFVQPDVTLGSGDSETIPVYITPTPCNAGAGTFTATLNAESAMTGDEVSKAIEIETIKCHYVSIDIGDTYRDICQENGEGKTIGVVIKNEGKFEEAFRLSTDTEWARFSDSSIVLDGGEERTVQLNMEPPEEVSGLQAIVVSAASDSSYAAVSDTLQMNIRNCFDFEASLTPAETATPSEPSTPSEPGDLPSVSIAEPNEVGQPNDSDSGLLPGLTGAFVSEGDEEYPWESMIVAVIIVIVVLLIIYIVVRG
jgi:uncharacterized membrane protein